MIIYTTEDGLTKIETTFDGDTVWLSIDQISCWNDLGDYVICINS